MVVMIVCRLFLYVKCSCETPYFVQFKVQGISIVVDPKSTFARQLFFGILQSLIYDERIVLTEEKMCSSNLDFCVFG